MATRNKAAPAAAGKKGARRRAPVAAAADTEDRAAVQTGMPEPDGAAAGGDERPATMKLKDLIDRVSERSGAKRKDVRQVAESVLAVMGEALARGETLSLPNLGKVRVNRHKDVASGEVLTVKIKRVQKISAASPAAEEALAEAAE